MGQRSGILVALLVLALVAATGGCKKPAQTVPEPDQEQGSVTPAERAPEPTRKEVTEPFPRQPVEEPRPEPEPTIEELNRQGVLRTIYFDFDSSELTESARRTLQANADWLEANPKRTIVVEGHCDERGTIEYNIALGDRRARSVREYLQGLGISPSRIRIVSYGEERPVDPGHDEAAWSKNRRAEFVIES